MLVVKLKRPFLTPEHAVKVQQATNDSNNIKKRILFSFDIFTKGQ